jgi:ubiquinone/menaquinone biosynthesis C-methylase UbiE
MLDALLVKLRAASEPTRLRLLALCAEADLSVGELTQIVGQSQPRVSRHLKVLCDAGLLDRAPEGTSVFYRMTGDAEGMRLSEALLAFIPSDDPIVTLDRERLRAISQARGAAAAEYFRENAAHWHEIRSFHVDEAEVEAALSRIVCEIEPEMLLDIGTGTGRVLELLGPVLRRGLGVDLSREMLAVARVNLERAGLRNCALRQADMYQLPLPDGSFDLATLHQVLHFAENPQAALREVFRVLRAGGHALVVDFAPHELEQLRADHAHRRLGFSDGQVHQWFEAAGFEVEETVHLPGDPLTVCIWRARSPGPVPANLPKLPMEAGR